MKRVLIISSSWPPVTSPDMQRARMACAHLCEFGWEPLILTVNPDEHIGPKDSLIVETLPKDLRVWRAGSLPVALTSLVGIRNVALRSYLQLARLGAHIIETEKPSVIFFSTTMFALFALGPRWLAKFGVPYVLDFHDPWTSSKALPPPTSIRAIKRRAVDLLARALEPLVVRKAAHIVCVSPAYPPMFRARYPDVQPDRFTVLPFAAAVLDMEIAGRVDVTQQVYDPNDGFIHWVYTGAGVPEMALAARAFFLALAQVRARDPERMDRVRVHLIGTDYSAEGQYKFAPLAAKYGVSDLVIERPQRVTYLESLRCLQQADALLIFGLDDPGYTASKVYPYVLARKPLLALCHEQSSVVQVVNDARCGTLVKFASGDTVEAIAECLHRDWFSAGAWSAPDTDWSQFERYSARNMTRTLSNIFSRVVDPGASSVDASNG